MAKVPVDKGAARSIPATTPAPVANLDGDSLDNAQDVVGLLWHSDMRGNLGRSSPETIPYGNHPYSPDPPGARRAGIDISRQWVVGDKR